MLKNIRNFLKRNIMVIQVCFLIFASVIFALPQFLNVFGLVNYKTSIAMASSM